MGVTASTNPVLKAVALVALVVGAFSVIRGCTRGTPAQEESLERLDSVSRADLSAEGDTEEETLRTLIAEVRRLHEEYSALEADNEALREQNARLERMEARLARRLEEEVQTAQAELNRDRAQVERQGRDAEGLLETLERRVAELTGSGDTAFTVEGSDIPVGLGLEPYLGTETLRWVDPLDAPPPDQGGERNFPTRVENLLDRVSRQPNASAREADPVYTVPRNSTLVGARGFTALIGRIPVGGQVVDPFPFKILVGQDNLAANGFVMPQLFGMVFSGRAVGDWTLSCVRGEVFSVTYVLEDGSIQSYPHGATDTEGTQPIGWISDPHGVPCVQGERKSNAPAFLSQRIGLAAAAAAAQAAAAAETATTVSGVTGTATTAVTGSVDAFVRNRTVSQSIDEVARWLNERQDQSFDAVYVPPDRELVVHVTRELAINFDPQGRKVNHRDASRVSSRALD